MPKLVKQIPSGKYDIIGDIHGEIEVFNKLMVSLGYDLVTYSHPDGRIPIIAGDMCDRGPDSYAVLSLVYSLVSQGKAHAIVGNHELNVVNKLPKDGTGWVLDRGDKDNRYLPFKKLTDIDEINDVFNIINSFPVVIESPDFRVVHACWDSCAIADIRAIDYVDSYSQFFTNMNKSFEVTLTTSELDMYREEQRIFKDMLHNKNTPPPYLKATANYNFKRQRHNPIRVLTAGAEQPIQAPMFAGGEWRFLGRSPWWDSFEEEKPVFIGHYWRKVVETNWILTPDYVFKGIPFNAWMGASKSVFCVDFSIGARFIERNNNMPEFSLGRLGAVRMPEEIIIFENGEVSPIINM